MDEQQTEQNGTASMMSAWMKSVTDSWNTMGQMWLVASKTMTESDTPTNGNGSDPLGLMGSFLKSWSGFASTLSAPDSIQSGMNGVGSNLESILQLTQTRVENYLDLQRAWMEKLGKTQDGAKSYNMKNMNQDFFKNWHDLYETEIKQYLNIPQLGLMRFHQERGNQAIDKFNSLQSVLAEFTFLVCQPIEKSIKNLQDRLAGMADEGTLVEDTREYYRLWIKILEDQYMQLFASNDYTETLSKTLVCLAEFTSAKDEVLEAILSNLPIPNQKEMDELYRELYLLKKKVKKLEQAKN